MSPPDVEARGGPDEAEPEHVLVLLHGFEDEPDGRYAALVEADRRWSLVEPRGPLERPGGPSWFASDVAGVVEADLVASTAMVSRVVTEQLDRVPPAVVVLGGSSQGGATALACSLRSGGAPPELVGVFAINAYLPAVDLSLYDPAPLAAAAAPVLIVASADDQVVPPQQARAAARYLDRAGVAVTYVEVAGGHSPGPAAIDAVRDWLADR
jgi:predicted esterase